MMILPCAFWPLAEHASFGQNCFDASIGSVSVCICYSMPMDACFFNHSFPFHRIVGFYQKHGSRLFVWSAESTGGRYQGQELLGLWETTERCDPFRCFPETFLGGVHSGKAFLSRVEC